MKKIILKIINIKKVNKNDQIKEMDNQILPDKITKEEFINYYEKLARDEPDIVRENIKSMGYWNNFKKMEINRIIERKDIKKLPRYILGNDKNVFNDLVKILEEEFNKKIKQFEDKSNNKIKQFEDESNNKIKQIEIKDINNLLKIFKGSRVLSNNNEEIMISNWIKPNSKIKVNLLYQISRDGDNISTFYNKVKNKYPTLILIKSKSGYKFGGYTTQIWEKTWNYKKDKYSFLFLLIFLNYFLLF